MISMEKVKSDLHEIQYYYSRKQNIDELFHLIGKTELLDIVAKYNTAICHASAKLFDLYGCLYVQNKTQEAVADEMRYSPEYIRRLSKDLTEFFQNHIN